jgi:TPR repeat protein
MFGRKKKTAAASSPPPAPAPTPARGVSDVTLKRIEGLIDGFFAAQNVPGTQGPITGLVDVAGLQIAPMESSGRTFWTWIDDNAEHVPALTRVQVGLFADEFHDSFAPQAPFAAATLGKASDALRTKLLNRAFEACAELDGDQIILPRLGMPVRHFQGLLSQQLGRPIEHAIAAPADNGSYDRAVVDETLKQAEAGDESQQAIVAAAVLTSEGRHAEALQALEHGGQLGNVEAMLGAADLARELGRDSVARFWNEQAATAGSPVGMFNRGLDAFNDHNLAEAAHWFEASAQAGNAEGYAALIEVAGAQGDESAAARWAAIGAQRDHPRCLEAHALNTLRGREHDPAVFGEAIRLMERAAQHGYASAMDRCGMFYMMAGNRNQAKYWWQQAVAAGDPDAAARLAQHGMA